MGFVKKNLARCEDGECLQVHTIVTQKVKQHKLGVRTPEPCDLYTHYSTHTLRTRTPCARRIDVCVTVDYDL